MKKLLFISILLSTVFLSCNKEPGPEPEVIRAYCYFYHFIPEMQSVIWQVDEFEVPDEKIYSQLFPGALILDSARDEMLFAVKDPGSGDVLSSYLFPLEQDKFYNVIACGSMEDPILLINEIDGNQPAAGNAKFQFLHAIPDQGPIDLYMGDTTMDKRILSALEYLEFSDPFEALDFDARVLMVASAHSEGYVQDSVLVYSEFNDQVVSGASYLSVVAHQTWDTDSQLTFWLFSL